jgi:hypothetical protein
VLEFLSDYPFVVFLAIYALVRLLKGGKKGAADAKAPTAASPAVEEAKRRALARQAASAKPFDQRLEELALRFEQKLSENAAVPTVRTGPREPLVAIGEPMLPERASLEAASLEIGSVEEVLPSEAFVEPARRERGSFDLNGDAFEFHPTIDEPEAKAFHLDTFAGFHTATGQRVETASVEAINEAAPLFDELFGDGDELRRAFVLSEILGKPRALRGPRA